LRWAILLAAALYACLLVVGAVIVSGYVLSAPVQSKIGAPPRDLVAETVAFPSPSGAILHGWLTRGARGQGVVILMHPLRANRRAEIRRMRLLAQAGYATLAFDFQSHGESLGKHITFGRLESLDAEAAVGFARRRFPGERIGVIGQSLGGAAVLLAPHPLPVDAVVLESVYPDIGDALCDRLDRYLGPAGCLLTPVYLAFMPMVIGVRPEELRPIDRMASLKAPVLVLAGTKDDRTKIAEAEALFARAQAPKQMWEVDGAGHVDLLDYAPSAYVRHVMPFLAKFLSDKNRRVGKGTRAAGGAFFE
jgi:pimeloyl-ACP methyl ester carboxylesterase